MLVPLLVWIEDTRTKTRQSFAFDSSPVRIGRNKLNELEVPDDGVSQWHGILHFDAHNVAYIDLGSTNGTSINGARAGRNVEVALDSTAVLEIGLLRIRFSRAMVPPNAITRKSSAFLGQHVSGDTLAGSRTVMYSVGGPMQLPPDVQMVEGIIAQTQAVYSQYVHAGDTLKQYLEHYLQQVPAERRAGTVLMIGSRFPMFKRSREYRQLGTKAGLTSLDMGEVDVEDWTRRLLYGTEIGAAPQGAEVVQTMERIGALLETFAQSYVDLRSGHEQFLHDIGIRLNTEEGGLGDLKNSKEVLGYLLDWKADGQARIAELNRGFADIALHQVGLLNGLIEGVRTVLTNLLPEVIAGLPPNVRSPEVRSAALGGLFGGKAKQWWRDFSARHADLENGDRFAKDIFGRSFSTAYLTIMGNIRRR